MTTVTFLLEEPSARDLLEGLLPRLLPASVQVRYFVFQGKQDLERNVARKLRAWQADDTHFVVLRDQDAAECFATVRDRLRALAVEGGRPETLVRVACRELESWVLGDMTAVAAAFGNPALGRLATKKKFRNPDLLVRPVEELRKLIPTYQKREGARLVGRALDVDRNQSPSFRAFCQGLARLIPPSQGAAIQNEDCPS